MNGNSIENSDKLETLAVIQGEEVTQNWRIN